MSEIKDPDAVVTVAWDWTLWLANRDDDTIASHEILAEDGITVDESTNTTTTVTAWLSGGMDGDNYDVTCRITTAAGRIDDRTLVVTVRER